VAELVAGPFESFDPPRGGSGADPRGGPEPAAADLYTGDDSRTGDPRGVGAGAIVIGSRGLTGVKSLLLGSVSHEVIRHADGTVVVVPWP
jgi:nucleotide-binding universal stress UspA family protein